MTAPQGGQTRIYRSLLRLYPADYRAAYGDQMVQLFADQLRDSGGAGTWLVTLRDLPRTAASEHLRGKRAVAHSMSVAPSPTTRALGLLGVLGGLVLLASYIPVWSNSDVFNLRLVLLNIGAMAIIFAVHRRQSSSGRLLALSATIPALIVNFAYLIRITQLVLLPGDLGPGHGPLLGQLTAAMWLADLWFGLVTLRLGGVRRGAALTLVIGAASAVFGLGFFVPMVPGSALSNVVLAGFALLGVGWLFMGIDVAMRRRAEASIEAR